MGSFIIVGTAGHVDHGKTQLVKALTGIDTDRLKEEKERGISIELGFAPLYLDGDVTAGIVDVPGHERFVKNMLAGAGGIDLVLFVVAADEGVMPQTREHLDILELLHVQKGIVALTKTDLVEEDWLLLVREDIEELLAGTRFKDAPIVPVSVVTGDGLADLRSLLQKMALDVMPKSQAGEARLPIDRIFSIIGFGTVLTGTLISGKLSLGAILEILPTQLQGRVRSLQVHGKKVEEALAGQRVAVNLTGIEVNKVSRGDVLVTPGAFRAVKRLTASLQLLERSPRSLKNWQRLRVHLGTKETTGRVRLLDCTELPPGGDALVQLELEEPVVTAVHDRFVIRRYSPVTTIGGGEVIEVGGRRHRRFRDEVLSGLRCKLTGSPEARVAEELRALKKPIVLQELAARAGLGEAELKEIVEEMSTSGGVLLFDFGNERLILPARLAETWWEQAETALRSYQGQYPLRPGFPKEELRSRVFNFLTPRFYQALLERWTAAEKLVITGQSLSLPGFTIKLTPRQAEMVKQVQERLISQSFTPPGGEEILDMLGGDTDLFQYCIQQGILLKITEDLYFAQEAITGGWTLIEAYILEHGEITVADARDLLGTSRRYCLPLLEYFDRTKKTLRIGDKRVLFAARKN